MLTPAGGEYGHYTNDQNNCFTATRTIRAKESPVTLRVNLAGAKEANVSDDMVKIIEGNKGQMNLVVASTPWIFKSR